MHNKKLETAETPYVSKFCYLCHLWKLFLLLKYKFSENIQYLTLKLFENKFLKIFPQRNFSVDEGLNVSLLAVNHLVEISLVLKSKNNHSVKIKYEEKQKIKYINYVCNLLSVLRNGAIPFSIISTFLVDSSDLNLLRFFRLERLVLLFSLPVINQYLKQQANR